MGDKMASVQWMGNKLKWEQAVKWECFCRVAERCVLMGAAEQVAMVMMILLSDWPQTGGPLPNIVCRSWEQRERGYGPAKKIGRETGRVMWKRPIEMMIVLVVVVATLLMMMMINDKEEWPPSRPAGEFCCAHWIHSIKVCVCVLKYACVHAVSREWTLGQAGLVYNRSTYAGVCSSLVWLGLSDVDGDERRRPPKSRAVRVSNARKMGSGSLARSQPQKRICWNE